MAEPRFTVRLARIERQTDHEDAVMVLVTFSVERHPFRSEFKIWVDPDTCAEADYITAARGQVHQIADDLANETVSWKRAAHKVLSSAQG